SSFFFYSRRRHTRFSRDWSSDVCSSDLGLSQVLFNLPSGNWAGGERGIAVLPDRVDEFRAGVDKAIEYARILGCPQVNCLAGIPPKGADSRLVENVFVENRSEEHTSELQ